jgi:CRISPR-associated protein Cas2
MKLRSEYLLCYDVTDTKKRSKLFERLKDFGLFPVQRSVFWGSINRAEKRAVERLIGETIDPETDRVLFFAVDAFGKNTYMLGHRLEDFQEKKFGIF